MGRDVLGSLQALDLDWRARALADGRRRLAHGVECADRHGCTTRSASANAPIDRWRLGPETAASSTQIDAAHVTAADELPTDWARPGCHGTDGGRPRRRPQRSRRRRLPGHRRGPRQRWADALALLDDAAAGRARQRDRGARPARAQVRRSRRWTTCSPRYAAYDAALCAPVPVPGQRRRAVGRPVRRAAGRGRRRPRPRCPPTTACSWSSSARRPGCRSPTRLLAMEQARRRRSTTRSTAVSDAKAPPRRRAP